VSTNKSPDVFVTEYRDEFVQEEGLPVIKNENDRRVQRTRQLLQDTLVALILEKGYEAVTVQDILDRANLGRSTFYSHYPGKDDLLRSLFENIHKAVAAHGMDLALFQYAQRDQNLFKALLGKEGGSVLLKEAQQQLASHMSQHLKQLVADEKKILVPLDVLVHYLVSAFLALLVWWLDNDLPYSAERMNEIFRQLTMPGFADALGMKINL
jgi:AcrR family transcriptional regulator